MINVATRASRVQDGGGTPVFPATPDGGCAAARGDSGGPAVVDNFWYAPLLRPAGSTIGSLQFYGASIL